VSTCIRPWRCTVSLGDRRTFINDAIWPPIVRRYHGVLPWEKIDTCYDHIKRSYTLQPPHCNREELLQSSVSDNGSFSGLVWHKLSYLPYHSYFVDPLRVSVSSKTGMGVAVVKEKNPTSTEKSSRFCNFLVAYFSSPLGQMWP